MASATFGLEERDPWEDLPLEVLWGRIQELLYAVLHQALSDATAKNVQSNKAGSGLSMQEHGDAQDFLQNPDRLGDICEPLGINTAWAQKKLRVVFTQTDPQLLHNTVAPRSKHGMGARPGKGKAWEPTPEQQMAYIVGNLTIIQLARDVNRSRVTVRNVLKKLGIYMPLRKGKIDG